MSSEFTEEDIARVVRPAVRAGRREDHWRARENPEEESNKPPFAKPG
jgi:hypothetical protein